MAGFDPWYARTGGFYVVQTLTLISIRTFQRAPRQRPGAWRSALCIEQGKQDTHIISSGDADFKNDKSLQLINND